MICHVGQCSMCFLNVFWCKIIYTRCSIARGGIPSLVIMGDPVCTANVVVVVFDTKKKHLCKKNSIKKHSVASLTTRVCAEIFFF